MRPVVKYSIALVAVLAFAAYSIYAMLFFAWAATAPSSAEIHEQARFLSRAWSAGFSVALAIAGAIVWRMVRSVRAKRAQP
jgi:chromate transport protein ChrA